MKIKIYNYSKKDVYPQKCKICGKLACRSIYNDSLVGGAKPAWFACNKRKCYIMIAFMVLGDIGANNE